MARDAAWNEPQVIRNPSGTTLWGWWVVATTLGWALSGALIGASVDGSQGVLQYAFIPLSAVGQWLLLRRHFAQASWWLIATTTGALAAGIGYSVILALPAEQFGPATSGLRNGLSMIIDGLALAIAQWSVLRGNVPGAGRWIPATASPLWIFAAIELDRGPAAAELMETISRVERIGLGATGLGILGLLIGIATGGLLMWLVEQPRYDELDR
jgi:hypothetical protein